VIIKPEVDRFGGQKVVSLKKHARSVKEPARMLVDVGLPGIPVERR